MKRIPRLLIFTLLFCLCSFVPPVYARGLPKAVSALCAAACPTYQVVSSLAEKDNIAVILQKEDRQVLCVAGRRSNGAYILDAVCKKALREGPELPILSFSKEGSLSFSYETDGETLTYTTKKGPSGHWGPVSVTSILEKGAWTSEVLNGSLYFSYRPHREEDSGTLRTLPLAVTPLYEQSLELEHFDIDSLPTAPDAFLPRHYTMLSEDLTQGAVPLQVALTQNEIFLLQQETNGEQHLVIATWDQEKKAYNFVKTPTLAQDVHLQADILLGNQLTLTIPGKNPELRLVFARTADGAWQLNTVEGEDRFQIRGDSVHPLPPAEDENATGWSGNQSYVYGLHPWKDLIQIDLSTIPSSFAQAVSMMDPSHYAFINNPDGRLNLRTQPDRNAPTRGIFYNRTPVTVLEKQGEWTRVVIGQAGPEGWMMTKFLAFDAAKEKVESTFPNIRLTDNAKKQGVSIFKVPDPRAGSIRIAREDDFIIGEYGDEWFLVLSQDGIAGYAEKTCYQ